MKQLSIFILFVVIFVDFILTGPIYLPLIKKNGNLPIPNR